MVSKFTIRDTMKVKNRSFHHQSYRTEDGVYFHFKPGEIKEIPNKYILMVDGVPILQQSNLVVIEELPDLLEVNETIENRWQILDL